MRRLPTRRVATIAVLMLGGAAGATATSVPPARARAGDPGGAAPAAVGRARRDRALTHFVRLRQPVFCGGGRRREIALTFDDGPGPASDALVATLRRHRVRATFFLVGRQVQAFPVQARLEASTNALGDHTWSHPYLTALPRRQIRSQIGDARAEIQRATHRRVRLFRPPYGRRSAAVDATAHRDRLVEVLWSLDSLDYRGLGWRALAARILGGVRPGSIVLMHENHPQTLPALRHVLPRLRRRGFRLVTVPQLLADDPPSRTRLRRPYGGCG